ncbi:hypothetical protein XENORESO_002226 [Xenotaenia resolanae]|uniref:Uncharacterized protein n=1 Tax=Xenotaenia resolanae TaxID=208358 RepID=A0ABV0WQH5_9TELE
MELWSECGGTEATRSVSRQSKRKCRASRNLNDYIVEQTSGARAQENQEIKEQQRLFYSCTDAVAGEIAHPSGEPNSTLMETIASVIPESTSFLDPVKIKPLLILTGEHTENFTPPDEGKWTMKTSFENCFIISTAPWRRCLLSSQLLRLP